MLQSIVRFFNELMYQPTKVLWICLTVGLAGILLDGTALRLWSLYREHEHIQLRIEDARQRTKNLALRIEEAQRPEFIERAARDQFDLVKEGDLVFVFADESSETPENSSKSSN